MARQQVQTPGVANIQPQARPTDNFVQAKYLIQPPQEIVDLSQFSPTLLGFIRSAREDEVKRQIALGEATSALVRPFGSPTKQTPAEQENRKAAARLVDSGQMARSNNPYFRLGLVSGEARRAAMNAADAVMSDAVLTEMSRAYDENGHLIVDQKDIDEEFDRMIQPFVNIPAMENAYARNVATDIFDRLRATFHARVSERRDVELQKYHENEATTQLSGLLGNLAELKQDTTPEGQALYRDALIGVDKYRVEITVDPHLADPQQTYRIAGLGAIETASESGPENAIAMIDILRTTKIGQTTVEHDNSEAGLAYRIKLDQLEAHYNDAFGVQVQREEDNAKIYKQGYLRRVEDGVSEGFASGLDPAATYQKLLGRIKNEVEPRFQDEAIKLLDDHYTDAQRPMPNNAAADEELARKLLSDPVGDIDAWIGSIAGKEVSYGQAQAMRKTLQAEAEAWKNLPDVKLASDALDADAKVFAADRSEGIQDDIRDLTNDQVASANQRIQLRARTLNGQQRTEQMGSIVKEEYGVATKALDAFKADIKTRSVAFDIDLRNANNKGVNFEQSIDKARQAGLITRPEFKSSVEANQRASDISHYTEDARVQNMVPRLFPTPEAFNMAMGQTEWRKFEDARIRAFELAQEWALKERGNYESPRDADNAFTEYVNTKMRREVANALGIEGAEKPAGESSKPGGPTQTEEDHAKDGKAFQSLLEGASPEVLKLAAVKAYPMPNTLAKKDLPQSIGKFQANFGQRNGLMPKIRADARNEMATLARFDTGDQVSLKRALLNTGAATPGELLRGAMVVNGVTIPIEPGDLDPWKAMMFTSTAQFTNACATDRDTVYDISEKYGVQEADFTAWVKQQGLLLKVNGL